MCEIKLARALEIYTFRETDSAFAASVRALINAGCNLSTIVVLGLGVRGLAIAFSGRVPPIK